MFVPLYSHNYFLRIFKETIVQKMNPKQIAAEKAAEFVKDGMIIGLGTGSTVFFLLNKLGELVRDGLNIQAVSTSVQTTQIAKEKNIPLIPFESNGKIDLTIDGADEVDPDLNGIKGGGGALLFEKIIASASDEVIWIVDSSKIVSKLGRFPLPVEVIPLAYNFLLAKFDKSGYKPVIRKNGEYLYKTDSGNFIIDLHLNEIKNPVNLESELNLLPGVVENGLFINIADKVIVGFENEIRTLSANNKRS